MVRGSDPLNHNIVTQGEVNNCLQHIDESKKEQFLKVIADTQIILDEPIYDDSINGTIIRAIYTLTVTRKGSKDFHNIHAFCLRTGTRNTCLLKIY